MCLMKYLEDCPVNFSLAAEPAQHALSSRAGWRGFHRVAIARAAARGAASRACTPSPRGAKRDCLRPRRSFRARCSLLWHCLLYPHTASRRRNYRCLEGCGDRHTARTHTRRGACSPACMLSPGTRVSAALRFCLLAAHARRGLSPVVGKYGDPALHVLHETPFAAQPRAPNVLRATSV